MSVAIVVDLIHVLEYLWGAVWCFFAEGDPAAEKSVRISALAILEGNAGDVAAGGHRLEPRPESRRRRSWTAENAGCEQRVALDRLLIARTAGGGWPVGRVGGDRVRLRLTLDEQAVSTLAEATLVVVLFTSPAAVENASKPSLIAAATSAIATVACSGTSASSPAASGVVILTRGTFLDTVIPLLVGVSWSTPEPCQHGTARGGITNSVQQAPGQPRRRRRRARLEIDPSHAGVLEHV